jgi:hypothetical protein
LQLKVNEGDSGVQEENSMFVIEDKRRTREDEVDAVGLGCLFCGQWDVSEMSEVALQHLKRRGSDPGNADK